MNKNQTCRQLLWRKTKRRGFEKNPLQRLGQNKPVFSYGLQKNGEAD